MIAVFRYRPSPFCILDEVDAPLDEANVGRFNQMLALMEEHTQFIVVTHNRRTMEMGEVLYGVTMQEPGVSRLVSVRWDEEKQRRAAHCRLISRSITGLSTNCANKFSPNPRGTRMRVAIPASPFRQFPYTPLRAAVDFRVSCARIRAFHKGLIFRDTYSEWSRCFSNKFSGVKTSGSRQSPRHLRG